MFNIFLINNSKIFILESDILKLNGTWEEAGNNFRNNAEVTIEPNWNAKKKESFIKLFSL